MSDCKTVQAVAPAIILAPEESGEVSISGDRLVRMSGNGSTPVGPGAESWLAVSGRDEIPQKLKHFCIYEDKFCQNVKNTALLKLY